MSCNFWPILKNPLKNKNVLYLLLSVAFFHTRYQPQKRLWKSTDPKISAKIVKKAEEFIFYDQKKISGFAEFIFGFGNKWLYIAEFNIAI